MDDLVTWIHGVFEDCSIRAPFGIGWNLDRAEPPVIATVTPADCSTATVVLTRDDLLERINFVARLQAFLDVELDRPVPPCPRHGVGLVPGRVGSAVHWHCHEGDFECRVGDYSEALWPPDPEAGTDGVAPMLARRFTRRRLTGIETFGVHLRDGHWVVQIKLRPDADRRAIREAADPMVVEAEEVEAVRTVRVERSATDTEPAHRALTRVGAAIRLARLQGRLRRAGASDAWDFVVSDTPVRLVPDHRLGAPGRAVVLDASGAPFADEGDEVCCVGGFAPVAPVRGQTPIFHAGELRVYP
jgi:hypothetical protein